MTARFLIALGSHLSKRLSPRFFAESGAFFLFGRSCLLNELELFPEKHDVDTSSTMTTKELAEELDVDVRTVQMTAKRILDLTKVHSQSTNGRPTQIFNEKQATAIKQEIQKHHNLASRQIDNVTTEYEMELMTQKVIAYHVQKANEYKARAELAERKNSLLMHTKKTYTASEIAKELGISSAKKLNLILEEKGIQYKRNGTWLPTAKYSESGYYEIKQEILDNGTVVYNSHITQKGRDFILNFVKAV